MGDPLVQQTEATIREGVRGVDSSRLRGEVSVVHWSSIKQALEGSLGQLKGKVQQLTQERDAAHAQLIELKGSSGDSRAELAALKAQLEQALAEKAAHEAALASLQNKAGEDLASKCARLEQELVMARKLINDYELACDVIEAVVKFNLSEFESFTSSLEAAAMEMGVPTARGVVAPLASMVPRARELSAVLEEYVSMMNEDRASVREVVKMVRIGKDLELLWSRARCMQVCLAILAAK